MPIDKSIYRYLRSLFPTPEIGENKIIGFSQYFGYPLYFDTIVFLFFLVLPFAIVSICIIFKKNTKRKT